MSYVVSAADVRGVEVVFSTTSSTVTLPVNVAATPVILPLNCVAVATPVTTTPVWNVGAPVPALLVKLSALILPPAPANGVIPAVDSPKISGTSS